MLWSCRACSRHFLDRQRIASFATLHDYGPILRSLASESRYRSPFYSRSPLSCSRPLRISNATVCSISWAPIQQPNNLNYQLQTRLINIRTWKCLCPIALNHRDAISSLALMITSTPSQWQALPKSSTWCKASPQCSSNHISGDSQPGLHVLATLTANQLDKISDVEDRRSQTPNDVTFCIPSVISLP